MMKPIQRNITRHKKRQKEICVLKKFMGILGSVRFCFFFWIASELNGTITWCGVRGFHFLVLNVCDDN